MPKISVIIPCFNHGEYIDEAIQSVLDQTCQDFEIIVVNDGSCEYASVGRMDSMKYPKVRVIHTEHAGLPTARNRGIQNASGEFILPLDADDKIAPTYLEKALAAITREPGTGIVYCRGNMFGDMTGPWNLPDYRFPEILIFPLIHSCGLFRKADWERAGGYCAEMIHGWEDYDFWLSLIELGRGVHLIPEALFYYRQHQSNMIKKMDERTVGELSAMIFRRHSKLYEQNIGAILDYARRGYGRDIESFEPSAREALELRVGRQVLRPLKELGRFRNRVRRFLTNR